LPRDLVRDEENRHRDEITPMVSVASRAHRIDGDFVMPEKGVNLEEFELSLVRQAMERSGGNQTRAAELLGISRDQLRYRLKKLEETA
jgi:DNA-binding protein Fis